MSFQWDMESKSPERKSLIFAICFALVTDIHLMSGRMIFQSIDIANISFLMTVGRTIQTHGPEHLSVYQTSPKLWEREAFEEKLDGAPEATGEPGKFSGCELGRLPVGVFFSAGAGLLAWSHMPVETAQ